MTSSAETAARKRFRSEKGSLLVGWTPAGDKVVEFYPLGDSGTIDIGRFLRVSVALNVAIASGDLSRAMAVQRRRNARELLRDDRQLPQ